ncbi:LysR substrate-binding domain-containing protein [Pseudorhodoplanes sp.]|uniref:LysR substrate-binding domain-containing protein n=1 Tax=Pseudorhodoplanes sp. TaxID=1934341 RepID=UPI003D0F1D8B
MSRARIRQLEAFHAVLKTGSATRAAELLRISQPSVSKLLRDLEVDIGVDLFARVRKRLLPTPEGRRLGQEAEDLFLKLSRIEHVGNEMRAKGIGELRIAALPALGIGLIPRVLATFRHDHPGIRSALSVAPSQRVVEMVAGGEADIGFAYPVPGTPSTLNRHSLASLPAIAVLPRGHALASRRMLRPEDFANQPFVSLGREDRSRDNMDVVFGKLPVGPATVVETQFAAVACELVVAGIGIALVDAITARFYRDRLLVRPVEPTFNFDFGALTPVGQPQSSIAQGFLHRVAAAVLTIASPASRARRSKGARS